MNYDVEMENIISSLTNTPTLLLHSCCAPCSSAVISRLSDFFEITVYYYNPNIDTKDEYEKRKQEQIRFINEFPATHKVSFLDCDYDSTAFDDKVRGLEDEPERGARCPVCFRLRLEKTIQKAKELGFDYFGTTLTVSPYKNSNQLNQIGLELEKQYQVKFLVSDFKKKDGYKKSINYSKEYDLYRQDYCGCKYSKKTV